VRSLSRRSTASAKSVCSEVRLDDEVVLATKQQTSIIPASVLVVDDQKLPGYPPTDLSWYEMLSPRSEGTGGKTEIMRAVSAMRELSIVLAASGWLWSCDRSPSSPISPSIPIPQVPRETVPTTAAWPAGWVDLGEYVLTVAAASECGSGLGESKLPDDLRRRSYTAMLKQKENVVWVAPSGPGFSVEYGQGFYGILSATGATFQVRNADDGLPIGERLANSTSFLFEGNVVAAGSPDSSLAGTLSGDLYLFETTPPWRKIAWCSSMSHHFALSR
jgi:hypothetical protein